MENLRERIKTNINRITINITANFNGSFTKCNAEVLIAEF